MKPKKKEDLYGTKVFVGCPEMSERVQKKLFELGFQWAVYKGVQHTEGLWLTLFGDRDGEIKYIRNLFFGLSDDRPEVKATDILAMDGPETCHGKIVEIEGKKYRLNEVE